MRRIATAALFLAAAAVAGAGAGHESREAQGRHGDRRRHAGVADRSRARLLREIRARRDDRAPLRHRRRCAQRAAGGRDRHGAGRRAVHRRHPARHGPGVLRQLQRQRHQARLRCHARADRERRFRHRQGRPEEPQGQEDRDLVRHDQPSLHPRPAREGRPDAGRRDAGQHAAAGDDRGACWPRAWTRSWPGTRLRSSA